MKPYCNDVDDFPSLSEEIGDFPASFELNCILYDYSGFETKYLPSASVNEFGSNVIGVISGFGLFELIGIMLALIFLVGAK